MLDFPNEALLVSRPNKIKNGIVVALPSVGRNHIPKFSRHSWKNDFENFAYIAVADPQMVISQNIATINGTWFLSNNNEFESWLVPLAERLENIISEYGLLYDDVPIVFAGSSMGGYAALVMSSFFEKSFAFAECPQVVLKNYKHSKHTVERLEIDENNKFTDLRVLFKSIALEPAGKIFCALSDRDHLENHIGPLLYALAENEEYTSSAKRKLEFSFNVGGDTPLGHKQLPRNIFKKEVLSLMARLKE